MEDIRKESEAKGAETANGALLKHIRSGRYEKILETLKQEAMAELSQEERDHLYREMIALRNMKVVDALVRQTEYLDADMFSGMDLKSWNNREFANRVLARHMKRFRWQEEEACEKMLELACQLENASVAEWLIRKRKAVKKYPVLCKASDAMFACVMKADQTSISQEIKREMLLEAALSEQGVERLKKMEAIGYSLEGKNAEGKTLADEVKERISSTRYPKNRSGELRRTKNKAALSYLQREKQPSEEKKGGLSFRARKVAILAGAVVVVAAGACLIGYYVQRPAESSAQQTESAQTESNEGDAQESESSLESESTQESESNLESESAQATT